MIYGKEFVHRFAMRISTKNHHGCCLWTGAIDAHGYGAVSHNNRMLKAHRVAYELAHSERLRKGTCVLHRCDVPICCNPLHLYIGTPADNSADMVRRGRWKREKNLVGAENPAAKITPYIVRRIRKLYGDGWSARKISAVTPISKSQVRNITTGFHWSHVK
jgi:hypothetical protein